MATSTRISELPQITTITKDNIIIIEDAEKTTYKATLNQISSAVYSQIAQTTALTLYVNITELQNTIDSLPRLLMSDVYIFVYPGTYSDTITIENFVGNGWLAIRAVDSSGTIVSTVGATTHKITNVVLQSNTTKQIYVTGFNMTTTSTNGVYARYNAGFLYIGYCTFTSGSNSTSTNIGVNALENSGVISVSTCVMSNKYYAINVQNSGILWVTTLSGTSSNIIYRASSGGGIVIRGAGTITGTTTYSKASGGFILSAGALI